MPNLTLNFFSFHLLDNDLICDCRLSWLIELKNQTKNELFKETLDKVECTMKQDSNFHKTSRIVHNTIDNPHQVNSEGLDFYDDDEEGKTIRLLELKPSDLPCSEDTSDPTELPLSREVSQDSQYSVKVYPAAISSCSKISNFSLLIVICLILSKMC